jgi:hypothetical protein
MTVVLYPSLPVCLSAFLPNPALRFRPDGLYSVRLFPFSGALVNEGI